MNNPTPNKKREGKSVEIRGRLEFKRSHMRNNKQIASPIIIIYKFSEEVGVGNIATKYLLASYLELKRRSRKAGRVGDVTSIYLRQSRNSGLLVHGSSLRLCLPRKVCNNLTFTYTLPEADQTTSLQIQRQRPAIIRAICLVGCERHLFACFETWVANIEYLLVERSGLWTAVFNSYVLHGR
ncbi:hypothetical protein NC652_039574 [Populus alba x Populus x berolinensis]|nr:hypothetical protein NC652_039574 [Populus alba x Populus x berolinensis]